MMPLNVGSEEYTSRSEYLAHLQQLAVECKAEPVEVSEEDRDETSQQLAMLAAALEHLEMEVSEMRAAQDSSAGMMLALERRVSALEQSTPSPQSWRDLIQGIRGIREVVAAQAAKQVR